MHTKFWIFLGLHLYVATKRLTGSCPHLAEHSTSSFSNCHLFFISKAEHKHLLCTCLLPGHLPHPTPKGPLSLYPPSWPRFEGCLLDSWSFQSQVLTPHPGLTAHPQNPAPHSFTYALRPWQMALLKEIRRPPRED